MTLNIAEGAGEYAPAEKARVYRMAKRSETECAAIVDIVKELAIADLAATTDGLDQLFKIVPILVRLCKAHNK